MQRLILGAAAAALALVPVAVLALTSSPNDPYYRAGYQWALAGNASSTNAPLAWCSSTGAGILIADIDTGADFGHPDLAGKLVVGANFTSGMANPGPNPQPDWTDEAHVMDDYGHGTMTTGLMVAATNNGVGIAAEAPSARALIVKVFNNKGGSSGYSAYSSDVAAGIYWSVEHGAHVINLSLGPTIATPFLNLLGDPIPGAVQWAASQNVGVAIAAGNGFADLGATPPGQPANYPQLDPYALVVGAMGPLGARASYSQSGTGVNIFGPGGDGGGGDPHADILSTYPTYTPSNSGLPQNTNANGYAAYDGTSFATPYAAGTLALLMARGLSAAQARDRITGTAKNVGGLPVLDASRALGACPSSSGGGGTSCCGGGTSAGAGSSAAAAAAPAAAGHSPAAAATSPAAAVPEVAGESVRHKPAAAATPFRGLPAWAIAAVIAGVLCVAAAGGLYVRMRLTR